ncbi:MAG: helix-turn-helix domain-containing protein [Solobacterium sp.]|nr:helix-turn-helix domain-containing protein [Solobacterium sp.]
MYLIGLELKNFGITVTELARYCNVSRSTIYRWIASGDADKNVELHEAILTIRDLKWS